MAIKASRRHEIPIHSIKYSEKSGLFIEISLDHVGSIKHPANLHIRLAFAADRFIKHKDKGEKRNESSHGLFHMDKFINSENCHGKR